MFDAKQMIADEMAEAAQPEPQRFMIPPQRAGWIMRELAQAGVQPQVERGEDGFLIVSVDACGAQIIEGIMNHQSKRRFGTHPVHRGVNTVAALVATVAAGGAIYMAILSGALLTIPLMVGLMIFIWWARSVLNSDKSAARLFQPIKPRGGRK